MSEVSHDPLPLHVKPVFFIQPSIRPRKKKRGDWAPTSPVPDRQREKLAHPHFDEELIKTVGASQRV